MLKQGFELHIQSFTGFKQPLQYQVENLTDVLGRPDLRSSLFLMIDELTVNALRAMFRSVYETRDDSTENRASTPEQWIELFQEIIESNELPYLEEQCIRTNQFVTVRSYPSQEELIFEVINDGAPDAASADRIREAFEKSRNTEQSDSSFFFSGIPLIVSTLENMGLDQSHLSVRVRDQQTVSRLKIPFSTFFTSKSLTVQIQDDRASAAQIKILSERLSLGQIVFSPTGQILSISRSMIQELGLSETTAVGTGNVNLEPGVLPGRLYSDLFYEDRLIAPGHTFENYRVWIHNPQLNQEVLFNISGYRKEDGSQIITIWQKVVLENRTERLSQGSIMENLALQKLIHPYIPGNALAKAREVIRTGKTRIPDEVQDLTILFADLSGFTAMSENAEPSEIVDTLNLALGQAALAIDRNSGKIEKFMGDAIMALFQNPHHAVIAGVLIQYEFKQFNILREDKGKYPILFRIGIHSGPVIIANIGTKDRLDWTPIGDVVNTASRLERAARPGSVLISEETCSRIETHIDVGEKETLKLKGKTRIMEAVYVQGVRYSYHGHKYEIQLNSDNPMAKTLDYLKNRNF